MGSQQKTEEAKQGFREEKKGLRAEKVQAQRQKEHPATHRAVEPAAPSFMVFFVARVLKLWYSSCRPSTSL